ncbi:calcium/calmodulin-regulated receptor-like kinase 1 isoform X2 [Lactuca sativa]|uniref:calcium/calmodulin-regulated receptor-like kinase 1 isoform X2 n=1 Tax=Lactuca sativa TaxID=4236 RepID=UPI000CD8EEC7|nr:calcium/calmodulin-regulated receptor-like kinase 1 isoform X2 [Lactuca sativa]
MGTTPEDLHRGSKRTPVLHLALGEDNEATQGNINCENIHLDETMEAKISFFGFSKQGQLERKHDRNIGEMSKLHKSNMYSFGTKMYEILSGYRANELLNYGQPGRLMDVLQEYHQNNELDQFIDWGIRDEIDSRCLNIFKEIAYKCIMRDNQKPRTELDSHQRMRPRPRAIFTMDNVVERLEDAGDFQGIEM